MFTVATKGEYKTAEEALVAAQKFVEMYRKDYSVFEATKTVKYPVPKFEVIDLKAS